MAMRILVACETSGIGRGAFAALGHDVWSCDLLPAEDGSNRHIICDVRDGILEWGWNLLAVMHPPCTRLCRSGLQKNRLVSARPAETGGDEQAARAR